MKKIITLSLLLTTLFIFGQVPQGISYQAIALNTSGNPVASSNVRVRLSVLDASATGTTLYSETHLKTTNAQGLFNLTIGQGTVVSGVFNTINWATNSKFLKVELDATGGTNFVAVGTTQLLSVPYAMHAGSVNYNNVQNNPNEVNTMSFMTNTNAYIFSPSSTGGTGAYQNQWFSTNISGVPFAKSWNSFLTSTNAYVFAPSSTGGSGAYQNQWFSTNISGTPFKIVTGGSFFTGVATSTNAYAFAPSSSGGSGAYQNQWFATNISGTIKDIIYSKGKIGVLTTTNAYVFAPTSTGGSGAYQYQWFATNINGTALKILASDGDDNILVLTSTNAYAFGPSSTGGSGAYQNQWFSTNITGTVFQQ